MNRTGLFVLAAVAGIVAFTILSTATFTAAQTTQAAVDANMPENWQSLKFKELIPLAGRLQIAGKLTNARAVIEHAGTKATVIGECKNLSGIAGTVMGEDAPAFITRILLEKCAADFSACQPAFGGWALELLISQGKMAEANHAFPLVASRVTVVIGCGFLRKSAETILGTESNAFLADMLASRCMEDFVANAGWATSTNAWAVDLLISHGKTSEAKQVLAAAAQKTTGSIVANVYAQSKKVMSAQEAAKWFSDQLTARCQAGWTDGAATGVYTAAAALEADGKTAEARKVLEAGDTSIQKVKDCRMLDRVARSLLGAGADKWLAGILAGNCQTDLNQCDPAEAGWAITILQAGGKGGDANRALEAAGARVTTVAGCLALEAGATILRGTTANDWLAGILVNRCKDDYSKCKPADAARAAEILQKAGKPQEAKALLDAVGGRSHNIGELRQMTQGAGQDRLPGMIVKWTADYMAGQIAGELQTCSRGDAAWAAWVLASAGRRGEANNLIVQIESGQRSNTTPANQTWTDSGDIAQAYRLIGNMQKAKQWALKAHDEAFGSDEARQNADIQHLLGVATLLKETGQTSPGQGYAGYAAGLIMASKNKRIDYGNTYCATTMERLAQPVLSAESRQALIAELAEANGVVRQDIARVLAWSYVWCGQARDYKRLLNEKIAQGGLSGDAKASWLMARAYAEACARGIYAPMEGKRWMDQALATAESPAMRMAAVRQIIVGHEFCLEFRKALSVLESLAGQFASDPATAGEYRGLQTYVVAAERDYKVLAAAHAAAQKKSGDERLRQVAESRLAMAKARGDRQEIARWERVLAAPPSN
jgi:hypothetical protein